MLRTFFLLLVISLLSTMQAYGVPRSADSMKIVATVNEVPITSFDLDQRFRLAKFVYEEESQHKLPPNLKALKKEAFNELVNEKLMVEIAAKNNISVTGAEEKKGMQALLEQDKLTDASLKKILAQRGIAYSVLKEKVKYQLLWQKVILQYLLPQVSVSQQEVRQHAQEVGSMYQDIYTIVHIVFGLDPQADLLTSMQREREVDRFKKAFKNCDSLEEEARQFRDVAVSQPLRIPLRNMDSHMRKAVEKMRGVGLTASVRSPKGLEFLVVCDYRAQEDFLKQQGFLENIKKEVQIKKAQALGQAYLQQNRDAASIKVYEQDLHS